MPCFWFAEQCEVVTSPDNRAVRAFIEGAVYSGYRFTIFAVWNYVQSYGISNRNT
jgi:hypothetical protein